MMNFQTWFTKDDFAPAPTDMTDVTDAASIEDILSEYMDDDDAVDDTGGDIDTDIDDM